MLIDQSPPVSARHVFEQALYGPDDAALTLPAEWTAPPKPATPFLAAVVPVIGAVGLWAVTGSILSLWLAALGPLIAGATVLDAARGARRERRRAAALLHRAQRDVTDRLAHRHEREREQRWSQHPDVAGFLRHDDEIWRVVPERRDAMVLGAGAAPSVARVSGGGDDPGSVALRSAAATLGGAPIVIALSGVAVRGPAVVAAAVVRALVLQLCLASPPGELRIVGPLRGQSSWAEHLPHRRSTSGTALAIVDPGDSVPDGAQIIVMQLDRNAPAPPRCGAVLTVDAPGDAMLDHAGSVRPIGVEAVAREQAEWVAGMLVRRAERTFGSDPADAAPVRLDTLHGVEPAVPGVLSAVLGLAGREPFFVDLIADGPHAVVAGVTGSGKSELLVTWITSLCATHPPSDVTFLLADFKGGTAFDALTALPHVTGVITDLDGAGARRAIESLRAEVRWREAEVTRCGARDILDPRVKLPRLVIVVDEFAALVGEHPELHAVFVDVAARGRALGLHLILGTQRISGVIRDNLLANCPLRISLRVTDPADSHAVIGTDEAAVLPGGSSGRGIALVRRAADLGAQRVRIALTTADDLLVIARSAGEVTIRRPWLPELPPRVDLAALGTPDPGSLLFALADEPDHQRQRPVGVAFSDRGVLMVGAAGSGKSTALETLAGQAAVVVRLSADDPERLWDDVAALSTHRPAPGTLVVIDDLDAVGSTLPAEYAHELHDRLEQVIRRAGDTGILVAASARRLTGASARLADLLPRRVVLATASRADHAGAGGDPAHFVPRADPGRGRFDGLAVQIAVGPVAPPRHPSRGPAWVPRAPVTALVARLTPEVRAAVDGWRAGDVRVVTIEEFTAHADVQSAPLVVCADPDQWQRHWRLFGELRAEHDLVIDAGCAAEYRVLTGDRTLPPYCAPGRARAWLHRSGAPAERIALV